MSIPSAIVLINGKRKSGKDFFASKLAEELGNACEILHLSNEIKREYATLHKLNYELLLTDSPYKDKYRTAMIALGESRRTADPSHYCRLTTQHATAIIWIIVDNRRVSDMEYFTSAYPGKCVVVRVTASEEVRRTRGWVWKEGVDDVESECGLDGYTPDVLVNNEGEDCGVFNERLKEVVVWCCNKIG